jgi:hypothetical protein
VAQPLTKLDGWIAEGRWPGVACPTCAHGTLRVDPPLRLIRNSQSSRLPTNGQWPPSELNGTFSGALKCDDAECQEGVAVSGDWAIDGNENRITEDDDAWVSFFRLRSATPPLRLMDLPKGTPDSVRSAVASASSVLWASPAAAANRLRFAVEALLTARKVRRYTRAGGRLRPIMLHSRIAEFRKSHPDVADTLEAVKWVGNGGSHDDRLTLSEVLDGAAILEAAIAALYDDTEARLKARVRVINRARGLPRKSKTT